MFCTTHNVTFQINNNAPVCHQSDAHKSVTSAKTAAHSHSNSIPDDISRILPTSQTVTSAERMAVFADDDVPPWHAHTRAGTCRHARTRAGMWQHVPACDLRVPNTLSNTLGTRNTRMWDLFARVVRCRYLYTTDNTCRHLANFYTYTC